MANVIEIVGTFNDQISAGMVKASVAVHGFTASVGTGGAGLDTLAKKAQGLEAAVAGSGNALAGATGKLAGTEAAAKKAAAGFVEILNKAQSLETAMDGLGIGGRGFATLSSRISETIQRSQSLNSMLAASSSGAVAAASGFVVLALAASAVGAAAAVLSIRVAEGARELENASIRTGVSTQRLQELQYAFARGGVEAESLTRGLTFMERAIDSNNPALQKLGVTSRDSFTAFMQAAGTLSHMTDTAERAHLMMQVFGRGGSELLPILLELANNYGEVAAAAEHTGNVLHDKQLKALEETHTAVYTLKASFAGFGKQLGTEFAPWVTISAKAVTGLTDALHALMEQRKMVEAMDVEPMGKPEKAVAPVPHGIIGAVTPEAVAAGAEAAKKAADLLAKTDTQSFEAMIQRREEALEKARKKAEELRKKHLEFLAKMTKTPQIGFATSSFPGGIPNVADIINSVPQKPTTGGIAGNFGGPFGAIPDLTGPLTKAAEVAKRFRKEWHDAFGDFSSGVNGVFASAISSMTSKMTTFGSFAHAVAQGMAQAFVDAFAKIAAAAIASGIAKLLGLAIGALTGNPAIAFAATGLGSIPLPAAPPAVPLRTAAPPTLSLVAPANGAPQQNAGIGNDFGRLLSALTQAVTRAIPAQPLTVRTPVEPAVQLFRAPAAPSVAPTAPARQPQQARGGNTYVIQSFNPASVLRSLTNPSGALRLGDELRLEVARAS